MKIKQVKFKGDKTFIKLFKSEQPRGYNEVVEETIDKKSDQIRHVKFNNSLEKLAPHLLIYGGFTNLVDRMDYPIDKKWFDDSAWEDDPRYDGIVITGVIAQGKDAVDGIQLIGHKELEDGNVYPLKTPSIKLFKEADGTNYPLVDILYAQWESIETYAINFLNGETGATKQMEIQFEDRKLAAV